MTDGSFNSMERREQSNPALAIGFQFLKRIDRVTFRRCRGYWQVLLYRVWR